MVAGLGKEAALAGQGNQSAERGEVPENSILNCYEYNAWGNLTVCEETARGTASGSMASSTTQSPSSTI